MRGRHRRRAPTDGIASQSDQQPGDCRTVGGARATFKRWQHGSGMLFVEVIVKNLLRRKMRSVLTAAGLAVAVATTTALISIAWSFAASATESYASRGVDIVVVRAGVAERITSSLSAALGARLSALPEIAQTDGSLTEMVTLGEQHLVR